MTIFSSLEVAIGIGRYAEGGAGDFSGEDGMLLVHPVRGLYFLARGLYSLAESLFPDSLKQNSRNDFAILTH